MRDLHARISGAGNALALSGRNTITEVAKRLSKSLTELKWNWH